MKVDEREIIRNGRASIWLLRAKRLATRISLRKSRLFTVAAAKEFIDHLHPYCLTFVNLLESIADGGGNSAQIDSATKKIMTLRRENPPAKVCDYPDINVGYLYRMLRDSIREDPKKVFRSTIRNFYSTEVEDPFITDNIHDLLSDLFWPLVREYEFSESWLTEPVVSIAQKIYEDKLFDEMPILADVLEEAGCNEPALLVHCRHPGIHVRGCWVLDRILGKG